jgi:hypothetical protein
MTGRSLELAAALKTRRIDIACIQEMKWKGAKAKDIGEEYKFYYNGTRSLSESSTPGSGTSPPSR